MDESKRPRSRFEWLECSRCREASSAEARQGTCGRCGGVLLARYRLDEVARSLTPQSLRERGANQWRYSEVLPGSDAPVGLGEGFTPLVPAEFLSRSLGLERVWIKDESQNPTGSFKARGMSVAVTMARRSGAQRLVLPSMGNAGCAAAAYGAAAGLAVDLFLPSDTPKPFRFEAAALGARVHLVAGTLADCGQRARELAEAEGAVDLSTLREPFRLEGKKTMGYELAEQFDWELPEVVLFPTGGGTGIVGLWKAFEELEQIGLVRPGRRPRMIAVQAAGCAPIVEAHASGSEEAAPWSDPRTYASGLAVPKPFGDRLILQTLRESGGTAVAIADREMAAGQLELARAEGIFGGPETGAIVAAARRLVASGAIDPGERVVLFNTGTGLKVPRIPGLRVP